MATVTFSSGVHAGTRDASTDMGQAWFNGFTTAQFPTFSLTSVSVDVKSRTGPQAVSGHANLWDAPIEFTVERSARDVVTDFLAFVAVKGLLNGRPFTTLSGWRDAVAQAGYLANVSWTERRNDGGAAESFSVWGVVLVTNATVRGARETLQILVWPCCALFMTGTNTVFVTPDCYDDLPSGLLIS